MSGKKKITKREKRLRKARRMSGMGDFTSMIPSELCTDDPLVIEGASERVYGTKLSEALLTVCQPIIDEEGRDIEATKKIIGLGVIAWNLACIGDLGDDAVRKALDDMMESAGGWDEAQMLTFCATVLPLVKRKRELFPDIDSIIMHHEILESGGTLRLNVASTPYGDERVEEWGREYEKAVARQGNP
jgi:hypothetical protein